MYNLVTRYHDGQTLASGRMTYLSEMARMLKRWQADEEAGIVHPDYLVAEWMITSDETAQEARQRLSDASRLR